MHFLELLPTSIGKFDGRMLEAFAWTDLKRQTDSNGESGETWLWHTLSLISNSLEVQTESKWIENAFLDSRRL